MYRDRLFRCRAAYRKTPPKLTTTHQKGGLDSRGHKLHRARLVYIDNMHLEVRLFLARGRNTHIFCIGKIRKAFRGMHASAIETSAALAY
jgi:hypothetical protein